MAGLVDYAAVILDLRGALRERASWGRAQVLGLIDDLEQEHRVDESDDAAVLRRFGAHLTDTFLGLLPAPATSDPLDGADGSATATAMDDGADIRSHHETEVPCPPMKQPAPSPRPGPGSRSASQPTASLAPART